MTAASRCFLLSISFSAAVLAQSSPPVTDGNITTSDGVRIHYLEAGRGPAILFVPGLCMPGRIWQPQLSYFSAAHRVIAMDPRSQGDSARASEGHYPERRAKDIRELIEKLRLEPVTLVGWSMGGPEILSYVEQFGTGALHALAIVDSFIGDEPNANRTASHFQTIRNIQANRLEWTRNWIRSMFARKPPDEYLARLTADALKTPTDTMITLIVSTYLANGDDRRPVPFENRLSLAVRRKGRDAATGRLR